jgi:hypothetical protein
MKPIHALYEEAAGLVILKTNVPYNDHCVLMG